MIESQWPPDIKIIPLTISLPCMVIDCPNQAERAWLDPDEEMPGIWHLSPICKACAVAAVKNYE